MNKYTFIHIIIFTILIAFLSCHSDKEYENTESFNFGSFKQTNILNGKTLYLEDPVMKPVRIYTIDSFLVLINAQSNLFIDRYNLNTLRKTGEYISFGNGPEEMIAPTHMIIEDSTISILDRGKKKLLIYNKFDFCHNESPIAKRMIEFNDFVSNLQFLKNESIVTTITSPEHQRLSLYNQDGKLVETKGKYPVIKNHKLNTIQKLTGYECSIVTNEEKDKIFVTYKFTDLIEIYDINGNLIKRKQGPEGFFPSIIVHNDGNEQTISYEKGKSKDGYFSPIAYKNEIYVLYSGKSYNPDNYDFNSDYIFVFDWNGNPIRIYNLDTPIFTFTIDPQTDTLYGITNNPEFHIVMMQLDL